MLSQKRESIYKYIASFWHVFLEILIGSLAGAIIFGMLFLNTYVRNIRDSTIKTEALTREQNILLQEQNAILQTHIYIDSKQFAKINQRIK